MPRIARVIALDYPHHVTQRGTNRSEIFLDDKDRLFMLERLKSSAEKTLTEIWAYCLMDNHLHLLLVPRSKGGLGRCLHSATFRYAQYFNKKYERSGRLWQNRYFSCPVDKEVYLWAVVRYIENNPVRSGISKNAADWKWSSASAHVEGVYDRFLTYPDWLDESERENYSKFLKEYSDDGEVRKATTTGRPLGSEGFVETIAMKLNRMLKPKPGGRPQKIKL
ncbi:MAG: transposase [Thermodesulfovibrionales bacterium]|nr:transposase [Nitrospinota bacterium]MCG2709332.1 transposase [Thermodesulfovibrionales bacterium]